MNDEHWMINDDDNDDDNDVLRNQQRNDAASAHTCKCQASVLIGLERFATTLERTIGGNKHTDTQRLLRVLVVIRRQTQTDSRTNKTQ